MDVVEPVKFLYASDLRLDKPLKLAEGSGLFAPRARDVAYEATRRLIDCALSRAVDFVFLRGELCGAYYGAKAPLFLAEQTMRLSRAGIACYIFNEGAPLDSGWLTGFPLGVKWLNGADTVTCGNRELSMSELAECALMGEAPVPLQALAPDEGEPCGAWLVSLPDAGLQGADRPEREFIELGVPLWERGGPNMPMPKTENDAVTVDNRLKASFMEEAAFFRAGLDLRVSLLDVLKERGILKRVLSAETGAPMGAALLENMTEADVELLLKETCDMADYLLFENGTAPK